MTDLIVIDEPKLVIDGRKLQVICKARETRLADIASLIGMDNTELRRAVRTGGEGLVVSQAETLCEHLKIDIDDILPRGYRDIRSRMVETLDDYETLMDIGVGEHAVYMQMTSRCAPFLLQRPSSDRTEKLAFNAEAYESLVKHRMWTREEIATETANKELGDLAYKFVEIGFGLRDADEAEAEDDVERVALKREYMDNEKELAERLYSANRLGLLDMLIPLVELGFNEAITRSLRRGLTSDLERAEKCYGYVIDEMKTYVEGHRSEEPELERRTAP